MPTAASVSSLAPIAGDRNSVARLVPRMLLDMQNRGQLAAGMTSYHPGRSALLEDPQGAGDGGGGVPPQPSGQVRGDHEGARRPRRHRPRPLRHLRRLATGATRQPFEREHGRKAKWFAFAFNGQLANYQDLKRELLEKGDYHLKRDTDTEILMHSLSYELQGEGAVTDWRGIFSRLAEKFDGAYNIVLLTASGELVVVRDPLGFRPLCIAENGPLFAAASESVPLANLGFTGIRSLEPGTLAVANGDGVRIERFADAPPVGALLLRVDLLRQRRQHARRPLGLPRAGRPWAASWPGWRTCRSTPRRSSCRSPTRPRRRPTPWPSR